jgi:transcriptional regulator of acetoin/glycerol metabolism
MLTLPKNNGSRQKTAEELEISPATLWRKMKKYGIAE